MDVVKEDMAVAEVTGENAEDGTEWRLKKTCGWEKPKEEEDRYF